MKMMQIDKNSERKFNETQSKFLDTYGKKPRENSQTNTTMNSDSSNIRDDIIERLKTLEESMEEVLKSTTKIHINDKTRILKIKS